MLTTFNAILNPMLNLFICIVIGYVIGKTKILPENAATTVAKLETWIFCPALSFVAMARNFTLSTIAEHAVNIIIATIFILIAMAIAIFISRIMIKNDEAERGIYAYALTFGNYGYMGDPLVLEIMGDAVFANYKLFYLPVSILTYTWGINSLIPKGKGKNNALKAIFNPSTIGMLVGMLVGVLGLGKNMPPFLSGTLDSLSACMGPLAMILVGLTVSSYKFKEIISDKKVYVATLLRLIILPVLIIGIVFGIKELMNLMFSLEIGNTVLYFTFFVVATPLGMNTIVFPKAYGGNPKIGASMAMISHTLCVITIPILYALMDLIFK